MGQFANALTTCWIISVQILLLEVSGIRGFKYSIIPEKVATDNSYSYGRMPSPQISTELRGSWTNSTDKDGHLILYTKNNSKATFRCSALYPIKWGISGYLDDPDFIELSGKVDFSKGFKVYLITFDFDEEFLLSDYTASIEVACENVIYPDVKDKLTMVVYGSEQDIGSKQNFVRNSRLIPCYTITPFSPPTLWKRNKQGSAEITKNVSYNPTRGFHSKYFFDGEYICKKGSENVTVKAVAAYSDADFEMEPIQSEISAFTDESIHISCASKKGAPVQLKIEAPPDAVSVSYFSPSASIQDATVSANSTPESKARAAGHFMINGTAICSNSSGIIYKWNFAFYDTPEVTIEGKEFSKSELRFSCRSASQLSALSIASCENTFECILEMRCFLPGITEYYLKSFCTRSNSTELLNGTWNVISGSITSINNFGNGVAHCGIKDGPSKDMEFFSSLSSFTYTNWKDAPTTELVSMKGMEDILYANLSTNFSCQSIKYLFQENVVYEIHLKNGSSYYLPDNSQNFPAKYNITKKEIPKTINSLWELAIELPVEAVAIHCKAFFPNSTEFLEDIATFKTRYLRVPTMDGDGTKVEIVFTTNDAHMRLYCPARGEPKVVYQWLIQKNDQFIDVSDAFSDLLPGTELSGEGYLEFPVALKKYFGNYKCVGTNTLGKVEKIFKLNVKDGPPFETIIFTALALFLLVVTALTAVVVTSWKNSQNMKNGLRNLSDSEVQDFNNGRPELEQIAREGGELSGLAEHLPYKREYEIDKQELLIDETCDGLLGKGEYANVRMATLTSASDRSVAVKITKANIRVEVFKSMLSEIKIMTYIGNHENIVQLVGACTDNIKDKILYIVTEICELGSLEELLKKEEPWFNNLINEKGEIDRNLSVLREDIIDTLDLINFSFQIAKGMEFLASKSVIHIDLAARNVLINEEKVAKISDFGLSRKIYDNGYYKKQTKCYLPWQWMSPEALGESRYSTYSDVWSYGMTLYEVFTLGEEPFQDFGYTADVPDMLRRGLRPTRPEYCTSEIYGIMHRCWQTETTNRPTFTELKTIFEELESRLRKVPSFHELPREQVLEGVVLTEQLQI